MAAAYECTGRLLSWSDYWNQDVNTAVTHWYRYWYWVLVSAVANIIGYWILGCFLGIVLTLSIAIWDHSITYHPTQVSTPCLTAAMQAGTRFTYPGGMEGWVDLVDLIAPRPGVKPATFRSRVRRGPLHHQDNHLLILKVLIHTESCDILCKLY